MSERARAEWKKRDFFAEVAETLGTQTDMILAVREVGERLFVLYSPNYPEDNTLYSAVLQRDREDILQHARPIQPHPGMWEDIEDGVRKHMEEEFGE